MASRFSDADLQRWVERGLITSDQRAAIMRDMEARPPAEAGLTLTTLLYYSGGLLVLVAYTIFLGFQWQELDVGGRVAIAGASFVFFAAASEGLLRTERFRLPGELLQLVAVGVVPLLVSAVLDAAGIWPQDPGYSRFGDALREQYERDLAWTRMGLGGATMIAAAIGFARSRSPFVLVVAIGAATSVFVDATIQIRADLREYEWETAQALTVAAMGAVTLIAGFASQGRTRRDYTTWLYLGGLAGLAIGLATKTFPEGASTGWGVLWVLIAVGVLGLSIPLQQRLFAAAGMLGVFAYLAKLVFEVFADATAALAFVILGLVVVAMGMLYQRYQERLFGRTT
jgi:hypothetical protein